MPQILLPPTSVVETSEAERVLHLRARDYASVPPGQLTVPQWITLLDQYVAEERRAGVSSFSITEDAVPFEGTFVDTARLSCAVYNALPESSRASNLDGGTIAQRFDADDVCQAAGRYSGYWWGYSLYLNHCLCVDIAFALAGGGAVTGLVGAVIGGIPGIVLGSVAAFLAIEAAWLAWADAHCNNSGAFVSGTWLSVGTPWIKTTC